LKRQLVQRSRSPSHGNRNLVNAKALEPLKEFATKFTRIFSVVGQRADYVFKVMRSKVKATDHIFHKRIFIYVTPSS